MLSDEFAANQRSPAVVRKTLLNRRIVKSDRKKMKATAADADAVDVDDVVAVETVRSPHLNDQWRLLDLPVVAEMPRTMFSKTMVQLGLTTL
jgi:hypothetical protein